MAKLTLEASLADGPHALLARLAGGWTGSSKTWFEPDKLADESPFEGRFTSALGGRFALFEYTSELSAKPRGGRAWYGYHLDAGEFTKAWIDAFHTGTAIMTFTGGPIEGGFEVAGEYAYGDGPAWGWRSRLVLDGDDLVITDFNVTPDGEASRAIETTLRRR
jgi:hypothetical protein